jgi:predicted unusual protein kinase regulating ubiquinone biosynthesis (AarF/ABC1/UbiB family)
VSREFELFWGKNMTELSNVSFDEMRQFATEFRDIVYKMPFQVPQDVIFLARCVGILAGMCTGLDPQFNLWDHLAPYALKLMAEESRSVPAIWLEEVEKLVRALIGIPRKMDSVLARIERGDIAVQTPDVVQQTRLLEAAIRQVTVGIIFAAFMLGGVQLYLGDQQTFGGILLFGAFTSLLWLLVIGKRES